MVEPIKLRASAAGEGRPLRHFWSTVVGAGRANEGLRADWQRHLATVRQECGFDYVRFHGLLHDDMFVCTEREDGTPVLNFQYAPPTDLDRWSWLVRSLVAHWVDRYGPAEVREWYFEVWNEANLRGFFRGTRSEYFALYAASARAVKSVDAALRVGGPATSNFVPDARFDGETEDFQVHEATLGADRTTPSPRRSTSSGRSCARSAPWTRWPTGPSPTCSRRAARATRCSTAGSGCSPSRVHHYPHEVTRSVPASFDDRTVADATEAVGSVRDTEIAVDGLPPGAVVELETLDPSNANPVAAWCAMGAPSSPTREQTAALEAAARATRRESLVVPADGVLRVERSLAPRSFLLLRQVA